MFLVKDENDLCFSKGKILLFDREIILHKSYKFNHMILIGINKKATIKFNNGNFLLKNNNYLFNLKIKNADSNGIKICGSNNIIKNITVSNCKNTGIQITKNSSNNKIFNCFSYENNSGQNKADGFGCKFESGKNNIFKNCIAYNNEDDGFDLFEAKYGVKLINCFAYKNGTKNSTASGFKLGGFSSLNKIFYPKHFLKNCIAYNNQNYGFTANNQTGTIIMKKCSGYLNKKENFFFPKFSHPKALNKKELINGKFYLYKCYSHNQPVNITGVINENTGL